MKVPTIVTSTPRSGTVYAHGFLQLMGIDLGHEEWRDEGIVSWTAWLPPDQGDLWRKNMPLDGIAACRIVHLVRHPLNVLKSLCTLQEKSWDLIESEFPLSTQAEGLEKEARFWMSWNAAIEKIAYARIRVEDLDPDNRLGLDKSVNSRQNRKAYRDGLLADDVRFALGELAWSHFDRMTRRYGYELTWG